MLFLPFIYYRFFFSIFSYLHIEILGQYMFSWEPFKLGSKVGVHINNDMLYCRIENLAHFTYSKKFESVFSENVQDRICKPGLNKGLQDGEFAMLAYSSILAHFYEVKDCLCDSPCVSISAYGLLGSVFAFRSISLKL